MAYNGGWMIGMFREQGCINMSVRINVSSDELAAFCRRYRIRKLSFFGSVLRDDFAPGSDVDVLVEFELDARVHFLSFVQMQEDLSELLGRQVDLHTPNSLSRHFRPKVLQVAEVMYERA
jgi:predicted nucleotidyltransferase